MKGRLTYKENDIIIKIMLLTVIFGVIVFLALCLASCSTQRFQQKEIENFSQKLEEEFREDETKIETKISLTTEKLFEITLIPVDSNLPVFVENTPIQNATVIIKEKDRNKQSKSTSQSMKSAALKKEQREEKLKKNSIRQKLNVKLSWPFLLVIIVSIVLIFLKFKK